MCIRDSPNPTQIARKARQSIIELCLAPRRLPSATLAPLTKLRPKALRTRYLAVCSSHEVVLSTRPHPEHPVSILILHPREISGTSFVVTQLRHRYTTGCCTSQCSKGSRQMQWYVIVLDKTDTTYPRLQPRYVEKEKP